MRNKLVKRGLLGLVIAVITTYGAALLLFINIHKMVRVSYEVFDEDEDIERERRAS